MKFLVVVTPPSIYHLAMIRTLWHHWTSGERFVFNYYKHWLQLLLRQLRNLSVTILRQEGFTQG